MRPFVFLDRDGTLVRDRGYTHRVEDYALLAGVVEGLSALSAAGFGLAIVTNQSGIGRGRYDESQYQAFASHLEKDLAQRGVSIDGSYFCPHLPDAGCHCRKPAPGMLMRASHQLGAALGASWVVGNAPCDIGLAIRAGCRGAVWVHPGADAPERDHYSHVVRAPDVAGAAQVILAAATQ